MVTPAQQFLNLLWPLDIPDGEVVSISAQRPGGPVETFHAATTDELLPMVNKANELGAHVWLNVATRRQGVRDRGGLADCRSLPALWADLDVAEGAPPEVHKGATFATRAEALEFVARFPVTHTALVDTGYGYAAWWILDEPIAADSAGPLLDALKATVLRLSNGKADPSVYEVARMMRLPGTFNVKVAGDPRPVKLVQYEFDGMRWGADELMDLLDVPAPSPASSTAGTATGQGRPGDDYNTATTTEEVVALLVDAGCQVVETLASGVVKLARPGKDARNGCSMTVGWVGPGITHLFSSGWAELPPGTYTPFRLRSMLRHAGDYAACARELAALGYGGTDDDAPLDFLPDLDGLSVAEDFVRHLGDHAIHTPGVGWMLWDGTRYARDHDTHGIMRHLKQYVRRLVARATLDAKGADPSTDEGKAALAALKRARGYLERTPRTKVIEDAAGELQVDADTLDAHPELLNCPNGIVDLRTGALSPHDPALKMTKVTAATYTPDATTPDWERALTAVSPDMRHYLQVTLGLSIIGRSHADLVMIAYGTGGNGKGTILGAAMRAIGDYGHTVPAKLFTDQAARETQLLMPLRGARLAMAAETGEDHMLNMERLKALSGGDPMTDRYLYSTSVATWDPTHTLWLQTNARPKVRNTDEGTWRRLQLVPFAATYSRNSEERDEGLRDRLRDDPANRAAVLAWMVAGALEWLSTRRLPQCAEVDAASLSWRDEEDTVATFLMDTGYEVTGDKQHTVGAAELYAAYRTGALDNGQRAFSAASFKREMLRYAERMRIAGQPTLGWEKRMAGAVYYGVRRAALITVPDWSPSPNEMPPISGDDSGSHDPW